MRKIWEFNEMLFDEKLLFRRDLTGREIRPHDAATPRESEKEKERKY